MKDYVEEGLVLAGMVVVLLSIMFVAAAILTPPDVVSQIILALPMIVLYESGIWLSRLVIRRRRAAESAPSP